MTLPITKRDALVIGGSLVLWGLVMWWAARSTGFNALTTRAWGRWDTTHYLSIADSGYVFEHCAGVPNRGPTDYCGNSAWFPGYPYALRLGSYLGPSTRTVGRLLSFVALVGAWGVLWFGFLRIRGAVGIVGMALAAVFPSSVYYGAIFPISTVIACWLIALLLIGQRRWLWAGVAAACATVCYPSGVTLGILSAVPLLAAEVGDLRARTRAAIQVAAPVVGAYLLVLLNFQRAVGHWNAWFKTVAAYHYEPTPPTAVIERQLRYMGNDSVPGAIGAQTLMVLVLIAAATFVVVAHRGRLSLAERGVALSVGAMWILPLTLGGDLSLYRAESLLVPVVVLLTRLRVPVVAGFLALSVPVSYLMAELFFQHVLN